MLHILLIEKMGAILIYVLKLLRSFGKRFIYILSSYLQGKYTAKMTGCRAGTMGFHPWLMVCHPAGIFGLVSIKRLTAMAICMSSDGIFNNWMFSKISFAYLHLISSTSYDRDSCICHLGKAQELVVDAQLSTIIFSNIQGRVRNFY